MLKNNKNVRVMIFLHVCTVAIGISIANPFVALTIKKLLAFGSDLEPYGDFLFFCRCGFLTASYSIADQEIARSSGRNCQL